MDVYPISASQISLWLECQRKYSFTYIDGLSGPSTPSQELGTEVHRQLEEYGKGTPLNYSGDELQARAAPIAETALEFLPPVPWQEIEHEFMLISQRHRYYGLMDLRDPSSLTVYDHKTCSSFQWSKSPEDLMWDVQATLYAVSSMLDWDVPEVTLQWTYMLTRGKAKGRPVRARRTEQEAWELFQVIETVADEISAARARHLPTLDLPPSPSQCSKYGGCPFESKCNLSPKERLRSVMSNEDTSSLLARLAAAKKTATVAPGQVNPPEAASAPPPAPEEPKTDPKKAEEKAPETAPNAPEATTPQAPSETPPAADTAPAKRKYTKRAQAPEGPKALIGTLYVFCSPLAGAEVNVFRQVLANASKIISATEFKDQKGILVKYTDYRFVPFGQGPAVLLAAIMQAIQDHGRIEELVIEDNTPEVSICLNELMLNAERVVRGLR